MSGGHFDYLQYRIDDAANEIERKQTWSGEDFTPETLEKFKQAAFTLRAAAIMLQRVDWFLSGDDGEDSFNKRWDEDLAAFAAAVKKEAVNG